MDLETDQFCQILFLKDEDYLTVFGFPTFKTMRREFGYKTKKEMITELRRVLIDEILGGRDINKLLDKFYGCYI